MPPSLRISDRRYSFRLRLSVLSLSHPNPNAMPLSFSSISNCSTPARNQQAAPARAWVTNGETRVSIVCQWNGKTGSIFPRARDVHSSSLVPLALSSTSSTHCVSGQQSESGGARQGRTAHRPLGGQIPTFPPLQPSQNGRSTWSADVSLAGSLEFSAGRGTVRQSPGAGAGRKAMATSAPPAPSVLRTSSVLSSCLVRGAVLGDILLSVCHLCNGTLEGVALTPSQDITYFHEAPAPALGHRGLGTLVTWQPGLVASGVQLQGMQQQLR